ncbi:MAG: glutathione peroxidase, partial [Candidatus Hydrogenedentes bacterium]|nr:glutathione peroxidase [Candidatus Hydrogenedentota bacterium]
MALAGIAQAADAPTSPLGFKVKDIAGKEVDLAKKYDGKVCLIVNVASKCGLTPQYEQLVALDKKYKEQ